MNELMDFGKNMIGGADGPTSVFLAWSPGTEVLAAGIVIGLLFCFFGLKLSRVLIVLTGLSVGVAVGAIVASAFSVEGKLFLILLLACGLVNALLSFVLYKFGVFCMVFMWTLSLAVPFVGMSFSGATALSAGLGTGTMLAGGIALVAALILAVLAVKYAEPMLIIVTALAGALSAGPQIITLTGLSLPVWAGYGVAGVLGVLGMILQFMMHAKKIGKRDKHHADGVREKASVESEVEKARTILEDDDEEE